MNDINQRDPLTGLADRSNLWSFFDDVIIHIGRMRSYSGLLLININHLDDIKNDIGQDSCNHYIKLMAGRIEKSLWEMDVAVRFSEEQFIIFANNLQRPEDIHVVMQKIQKYLAVDCQINDHKIIPSTSIAIAILPTDGSEMDVVISNIMAALNMAKNKGDNDHYYCNQTLAVKIDEQEKIKDTILATLAEQSFILHLQPKIDTPSGNVCGVEALVRISDSEGNIVSPSEFIPIAENSNLILEIGDWVLKEAHKLSIKWKKQAIINMPISVNISDIQFKNSASFLSTLHQLTNEDADAAKNIILEISENIILNDTDMVMAMITEIKQLGFQISIDGFGSGFTSLTLLKELNIDEIKIDRQFVSNVPQDKKDTSILESVILLGKSLNFRVVVMGVENEHQIEILKFYHCDQYQGFLISEPLPVMEFAKWLEEYSA